MKVALIQTTSGSEIEDNLRIVTGMIREAAGQGAEFILTPENTCHITSPQQDRLKTSPDADNHPVLKAFSSLAQELDAWLLAGSVAVKIAPDKIANRSYLFDNRGGEAAYYDKIHLFDADLPTGESHRESNIVQPGTRAVVAETPWGLVGLSICYDLRFPHLYRKLVQQGARILTVPSAFTVPTGMAHWETLLRARAIENGSFVLAPAQTGTHHGGRKTYGHSMIIGPWGEVIANGGDEPGIISATLDMDAVDKARNAIPCLRHDREIV